jgi:hypothetical protein
MYEGVYPVYGRATPLPERFSGSIHDHPGAQTNGLAETIDNLQFSTWNLLRKAAGTAYVKATSSIRKKELSSQTSNPVS